jgi:RNA polymerase sigma-B factor
MAALQAPAACMDAERAPRLTDAARRQRRREDQRLLRAWIESGDRRARAALIERFLPLARSLAGRYHRSGEPLENLVQVASVALVKAIDRYDPNRGCAFTSFAVPTISGELKRHFRDHAWTVRPPRAVQELALRVDAARTHLWQKLNCSPTTSELATAIGVSDELGLEAREMLRLRFEDDMTQAEIGALFGVSQMQVSRILREAIARLQCVAEHRRLGCLGCG